MFAFLRKQKRKTEFAPYPSGYTPDEFRSNPGLVKMTHDLFNGALGGHILAALHNGMPYGYPMRGNDLSPTAAAVELGRVQGYMDCLNLLNSLGELPNIQNEIPQDYGADELLKNDQ